MTQEMTYPGIYSLWALEKNVCFAVVQWGVHFYGC